MNPDPRISLVSVLQSIIIRLWYLTSERAFLQRQLESQMIAWLHYDPFNIVIINDFFNDLKPRERFELPCNGSAVHRFASKLPWLIRYVVYCCYLNLTEEIFKTVKNRLLRQDTLKKIKNPPLVTSDKFLAKKYYMTPISK